MKLYKYLPRKYLDTVLSDGALLFRPLSYFQDFEDELIRGDRYDGTLKFTGEEDGLVINNLTTGNSFKAAWTLESKVDAENIFVFSVSRKLSNELAEEFKSDICIEFTDSAYVISKLHSAVSRRKKIKPNKLFHGEVTYYGEEKAPGITWAFPDQIAMRKLNEFSRQDEYRFMFSHRNALDFGKTLQEIKMRDKSPVPRATSYPEEVLKIGSLRKRCNVHEFT